MQDGRPFVGGYGDAVSFVDTVRALSGNDACGMLPGIILTNNKNTIMAKKQAETMSLIDTFSEFKETKSIDRTTMVGVLEESFRSVIAKIFGSDENFDVIVNPDKGDFEIYRNREVVADGEVVDENKQIALSAAQEIDADYEIGEEVSETINFAKFGRRAILTLRQTLASKILELEHDS